MIPSARRGRGRPSTRTKEEQKIRRREVGRESQQRFRTRMKEKEDEDTLHVLELVESISHWTEYLDLLIQRQLLTPMHNSLEQFKMVEIFVLLLRRGSQLSRGRQDTFARHTFTEDAIVYSERLPRGPESIVQQNERYALLYPKLTSSLASVTALPIDSNNLVLAQFKSTLPIKQRTVMTLFPHMASNVKFMAIVSDKVICVHARFTFRFNAKNQIECLLCEVDTMEAWINLVQEPDLVLQMLNPKMKQRKIKVDSTADIEANHDEKKKSPLIKADIPDVQGKTDERKQSPPSKADILETIRVDSTTAYLEELNAPVYYSDSSNKTGILSKNPFDDCFQSLSGVNHEDMFIDGLFDSFDADFNSTEMQEAIHAENITSPVASDGQLDTIQSNII